MRLSFEGLALAAQSDLVLLTAEMLRPPERGQIKLDLAWWQSPCEEYFDLISVSTLAEVEENGPMRLFEQFSIEQVPTLRDAFEEVYQIARKTDVESWIDECWRLFEGAQACPLNQASYIRRDKGAILGDLAGFYAAFGWKNNPVRGERPDYLIAQLEFIGLLLAMASQARDLNQKRITHQALTDFARLHMHDWLPSVCVKMTDATTLEYYGAVARWLITLWMHLTHRNQWPIDSLSLQIQSPFADPEDPYECGAPDLVNIHLRTSTS